MADERTYIKVHDGMPDHWKIEALSDRAFRLLIETWCWCSRHLNDGRFPESSWKRRGTPKARKEIEATGLVQVVDGQVVMHDYLEHQRSAGQVEEIREKKRMGAALANHKRWHEARSIVDPECRYCDPGAITSAKANRPDSDPVTDNGPIPPEAETEAEKRTTKGSGTPASGTSRASVKRGANGSGVKADLEALAGSAHSPAAHRLVQDFAATRSQRPPARVLAQLGPLVDELLEQDWPGELIGQALTAWGDKGLDPSRLHSVANEVANRKPANGSRPSTTDERVAAARALRAHYEEAAT